MNRSTVCAVVIGFCLTAVGLAQEQKEKKVNNKNVPAAVISAAANVFPNAKVKGWSKETEDGKTFYEAEMIEGQTKRDVLFRPDGNIEIVEEEIVKSSIPEAVQSALKSRYPKAEVDVAEKLIKDGAVQYELHLKKAPKKEIVFTPEGKFVKEE
jgi:uncharacterized membrane protein YkoI